MKSFSEHLVIMLLFACVASHPIHAQADLPEENTRAIEFPDIPGYLTLKCDFHMHTVFSDGSVWPDIRVQEAIHDGLDAIAITDHLEYQPKEKDIPHPDRNRSYQVARRAARGSELIIINGAEITRNMPPGHANAIFIKDANALDIKDVWEVFREAKKQGAFVFWNHPHWTSQQEDGVATLTDMHHQLFEEQLLQGIEIFNHTTYSEEALTIALEQKLTLMGTSDIHGLVDWEYDVSAGDHRPVTLVFAEKRSKDGIKEALENRRTAVWFHNTLVGSVDLLSSLVKSSLEIMRQDSNLVQKVGITNHSDADYIIENLSDFTLHDRASVFTLKAHETTWIYVKTLEVLDSFELRFKVLNAYTAPKEQLVISLRVE